jgi:hypothetical protein
MPIFFLLFRVLRDPYKHIPKTGSFNQLYNAFCHGYGHLCGKTVGGKQLLHPVTFLGMDLQKKATEVHGVTTAAPYFILVGLVVVTGLLQTRQQTSRTPQASKQMGTVMKVLPIFFGLISLQFPAGLVLYFFVSNLCRVAQQEVVWRRHGHELSQAPTGKAKLGAGAKAIDVASTERTEEPVAPPADGNGDGAAPRPGRSRAPVAPARAEPERRPAPERRPRRPAAQPLAVVQEEPLPGRGLRGFFQLPPPPTGNGGGRTTAPSRATPTRTARPARGTSSGPSGRPPPQRRSRSPKKKRKR